MAQGVPSTRAQEKTPASAVRAVVVVRAAWQHVSTGRNSALLESGSCTTLQIDPKNGTLYTNGLYGANGIYKSTNGGVDWDIVTPPASQGFPDFVGHIDMRSTRTISVMPGSRDTS